MLALQTAWQSNAATISIEALSPALLETMPVGILTIGAEGEIKFYNQAALNLLGLTKEQLLGLRSVDPNWQIIQADGEPFASNWQAAMSATVEELQQLAARYLPAKGIFGCDRPQCGDRIWLEVSAQAEFASNGNLKQVLCTFSDATSSKTLAALAKVRRCFANLGADPDENINSLTALAGELLNGQWALYNRLHQGLLCAVGQWRSPADFIGVEEPKGQICSDAIRQGSDRPLIVQNLPATAYAKSDRRVQAYQLQTYIGQAVTVKGESVGVLCAFYQHLYTLSAAEQELLGTIAAAIACQEESKRLAIARQQNETKWRSLVQNSSHLTAILETDATIRYITPASERILGYKPSELIGRNALEFVHLEDFPRMQKSWRRLIKNPAQTATVEFQFQHKNGDWRYLELTCSNLRPDAPGARVAVNFRDITERKAAEAALKQSAAQLKSYSQQLEVALEELQQAQAQLIETEKMSSLGHLVAGVAHEINNPVSFLYGNIPHATKYAQDLLRLLQLYQQHYPQPDAAIQALAEEMDLEFVQSDLPKLLNSMQLGAERIQQIVLSLRNFSRLDKTAKEAIDLHKNIDNTLLLLQHRLKAKPSHPAIKTIKDYGDLPLIECYTGQLNQVLMNIFSNAIDALEELPAEHFTSRGMEQTICITTKMLDEQQASIKIADNGAGMAPEVQEKLFSAFFTTKPAGKGTGLGLSISYQIIVEKHGGQLRCHSVPGEGTEFEIILPLQVVELSEASGNS